MKTKLILIAVSVSMVAVTIWYLGDNVVALFSSAYAQVSESLEPEKTPTLDSIAPQVIPQVYDDGHSTAYIQICERVPFHEPGKAMMELFAKKQEWEKMFPAKKIVSVAINQGTVNLTGSSGYINGLLIHYEQR